MAGVVDSYAGLAVSPDGRQVYAGSYPGGIAAFARDRRTGSSLNCRHPVFASTPRGDVAAMTSVWALGAVWTLAITPDGKNGYTGIWGDGQLATFARDARTTRTLSGAEGCAWTRGMGDLTALRLNADGRNPYVASDAGPAAFAHR